MTERLLSDKMTIESIAFYFQKYMLIKGKEFFFLFTAILLANGSYRPMRIQPFAIS
ncbi:MAG: hypothetical protein ACRCZZ_04485 [Phocaeicola sp.]